MGKLRRIKMKWFYTTLDDSTKYFNVETGKFGPASEATDFYKYENNKVRKKFQEKLPKGSIGVRYYEPEEWEQIKNHK